MKKNITKYGFISGAVSAALLLIVAIINKDKFHNEYSMLIGYTCMIAAMSFVYIGVKNYRDQSNGGKITFQTAFLIGLGIMLISCIMYSLMWLVIYYNMFPNFMEDMAKISLEKLQKAGASQADINKSVESMNQMKGWYENPVLVFLLTLLEPTPVGLLFSLISALILKKK
jgi:small-conductance mechanosensitive channel